MHSQDKPSQPVPLVPCNGYSSDSALSTWRQLAHTYLKLQRKVEEMLVPYGLVLSQFEALAKVAMNPGVIQQDLVKHLVVTKGNVGALVDRLEEGGLIERRPDPDDRRANRLFVTQAGRVVILEIFEKHQVLVGEMFRPLNSIQRQTLEALLKDLEPR